MRCLSYVSCLQTGLQVLQASLSTLSSLEGVFSTVNAHGFIIILSYPSYLGTTLLSSTSRSTQRNSFVLLQGLFFLQWWELLLLPSICCADPNHPSSTQIYRGSQQSPDKQLTAGPSKENRIYTFLHSFIGCKTKDYQWPVSLKHQLIYFN